MMGIFAQAPSNTVLQEMELKGFQIRITENTTRMLSFSKKEKYTAVSLHKIFLNAPQTIIEELFSYIKNPRKRLSALVKNFINEEIKKLDYRDRVIQPKLISKGEFHDLEKIYTSIERDFFFPPLHLPVTWFGKAESFSKTQIVFGKFHPTLRMIKIHRRLDQHFVPEEVVAFIMYHEMLHAVIPPVSLPSGKQQIHTEAFKRRERLFPRYREIENWLKSYTENMI